MSTIIVTGSSDGLGKLLCKYLADAGHDVHGITLKRESPPPNKYIEWQGDIRDFIRMRMVFDKIESTVGTIEALVNCAGINRIGYLEGFTANDWDEVLDTNAKGIFTVSKAFLPGLIASRGTILNIVSNASHMPMTGSIAYNASKGAAHIMTLQMARELTRRHGITVFGISPNKLAGTGMSIDIEKQVCESRGWTPEEARKYQLDALLTGEETPPGHLAEFITWLFGTRERHRFLTGCVIPYGA